jgi:valyl-tRNA synthetase
MYSAFCDFSLSYFNLFQCPWRNTEIESEVEFVQKIIHTVRSARSDYNLPNKAKTEGNF